MNLDELLLNINVVDYDSLVCQTAIQSDKDKKGYANKGYNIQLTEEEFKEKFKFDPSCVWYTPSVSCSSLYFNKDTLAAAQFHIDLFLCGIYSDPSGLYKIIEAREEEVANNDFRDSVLALPDSLRTDYFKLLVAKKGPELSGLYKLFFSSYLYSDYGFGNIDPSIFQAILDSKQADDIEHTAAKLDALPDTLKVYRGGNTASTPADKAYSWSLDINIANFFACRLGTGAGYIAEAEVAKKDVIEAFLDERNEKEVIADPKDITILREIPIRGLDFIAPILSEIAPTYHKYREQMENLDFAQTSSVHGYEHEARVLLHALTISHILDLPARDRKVLAAAAIYHDTRRTNDAEDPTHGQASREYYHASADSPDPLVEFLCEYHCLPDDAGYEEIKNNRKLRKNRTRAKLLFDVFKDADALDRVRFGLKDLDLNQLRLPVSKELSLVARLYLDQVKVSVKQKQWKPSLSSQIQSATSRSVELCSYSDARTKGHTRHR